MSRNLVVVGMSTLSPERLVEAAGTAEKLASWEGVFKVIGVFLNQPEGQNKFLRRCETHSEYDTHLGNTLQQPVIARHVEALDV
jgi:hypothetical protein